jgi:hypothetical protein
MTLGPDRTLYIALHGGAPFDGTPAAVVSLAPTARTRPGRVQPKLIALLPHPIALALVPGSLAVVDYGGAPGQRDQGTLRLIAGVGTGGAAAGHSSRAATPGSGSSDPFGPDCHRSRKAPVVPELPMASIIASPAQGDHDPIGG